MITETVCEVCARRCRLKPEQWGFCRARKNEGGEIVCKNYGQITSLALDPIEKKPLQMFYPGSMILSTGSFGCNLRCPFCQNYEISMAGMEDVGTRYISPEELAALARRYQSRGNIGVAFTYNEPLISWEYILDTARLLKDMKCVLVTNGSASLQVLERLLPCVDAMNIDLKGFTEEYYQKLGGSLQTVREFITQAVRGCHVELTTLIVPGENDALSSMEEEARWIASLNDEIPLHVTRFFPGYRMRDREATEVELIYRLADIAGKYLKHVFIGNC